ncbi:MAG: homocysteine S-methyltransferase family protein [Lachnospiraceae bacterium]|nr:homocysteine S-methyltransferase family protein [Lachnospiraceae bacterium]
MGKQITLLDGGCGTSLMQMAKEANVRYDVPVWIYNIEHPEFVERLASEYAAAGSKYILANTFGANRFSVEHFSDYKTTDVVREGVRIAHAALDKTDAKIVLSIGALAKLLKPYGPMSAEECAEVFTEQIGAGVEAGVDCILLQTFMDLEMMDIASTVALKYDVPVYCMMTFEGRRRTMMGDSVEKIVNRLVPKGIAGIGMNCSMGPVDSLEVIKEFREYTDLPIMFKPNSGKPITDANGNVTQPYTAEMFADEVSASFPYVDYVGGCCGTDPSYIKAIAAKLAEQA